MKSHAQVKGHPLHPMLVAFPIAFLCGCALADLAGKLGSWPTLSACGAYLSIAAIVSGLVAAVPGLIDYFGVIPPNSSAKQRATYHLIVNVCALRFMAAGMIWRDWHSLEPAYATIILEFASAGLVGWGGWLGSVLIYRNQIAVDHRYADAGKWTEQTVEGKPGESAVVAKADELKVAQMKLLHLGNRRVVLARTETGYVAFDDHCTHRGGSLADGVLACGTVTCPWHGSQFDVHSGAVKAGPAEKPISTYAVEETAGEVRLTIPS